MKTGIVIAPEVLTHLGPLPITNSLLVSWLVMLILVTVAFLASRKIAPVPNGLQNLLEFIVEASLSQVESLAHTRARIFFPYLMTFFLFIIVGNWLGLFPGFGTIGFFEGSKGFIPLLRSTNSDLNTTLALALISVLLTHFYAVKYLGVLDYLKHWVSLNPIFLFVGLLELVGEFTKIVSLSFRLFGNIFAGEVVLSTISQLAAFIVPLPFYFLEIIVGFVQAAVFMMLTLVFMVLLTQKHQEA